MTPSMLLCFSVFAPLEGRDAWPDLILRCRHANIIRLFILMDADTQIMRNHAYMGPNRDHFLPLSPLCWLQSTQTHLLAGQAARKEVNIWGVRTIRPRGWNPPLTVDFFLFFHCTLSFMCLLGTRCHFCQRRPKNLLFLGHIYTCFALYWIIYCCCVKDL